MGAGRISRKRARHLVDQGVSIEAFIDIDPRKVGRSIAGRPVLVPAELPPAGTSFVVSYVSTSDAREEIEATLRARGYQAGNHYIMAA